MGEPLSGTVVEPGSRLKFRSNNVALYQRPNRFTVLDPTIRAVRSDPIAEVVADYTFQLDTVPYLAGLAGYFEQYRIVRIDAVYKPIISEVSAIEGVAIASDFTPPDLAFSYKPYSAVPSTYMQVAQRGDAMIVSTMERWSTSFKPVPLFRVFESLVGDAFADIGVEWLSTVDVTAPFYGFTIAVEPSASVPPSPTFGGRVSFYYTVEFRYPRPA